MKMIDNLSIKNIIRRLYVLRYVLHLRYITGITLDLKKNYYCRIVMHYLPCRFYITTIFGHRLIQNATG